MATFNYTAKEKDGSVSHGTVTATDRAAAIASLTGKGLSPILIKESETGGSGKAKKLGLGFLKPKVKMQDKVVFSRQFATMIGAGVPIVQALSILKEQTTSQTFKAVISDLARKVETGSTLSKALADHPDIFTPVYVNMVRAGESGGILDQILERLATQQEKDAEIVSKVRGAMIYPSVIMTVAIGAFVFMMTYIVPKMGDIFDSFNAKLPAYTVGLIAVSKFMKSYIVFIIVGVGVGIGLFLRWKKTGPGKKLVDGLLIRLPLFGPIIIKVNVARFARTFGSLMGAGIAVLDALNTTALALGNQSFQDTLKKIAVEVKNGKPINVPIKNSPIFPPIVGQMMLVGEETGQLDSILLKLADFYEKEVEAVISNITSIIEPVMIIFIGALIGSIVVGIIGPLGSLTNQIH